MSLQTDARECLLKAVRERNNVDVPPEDMASTKPSDKAIGAQDAGAWLMTLGTAADHIRDAGWQTRRPEWDRADDLLNKALVESQIYLQSLARRTRSKSLVGALLLGTAAAAIALGMRATRRRRR